MKNYFDKKLVVFELANNHMGFIDHGIKIINTYGKLIKSIGQNLILLLNCSIAIFQVLFIKISKKEKITLCQKVYGN